MQVLITATRNAKVTNIALFDYPSDLSRYIPMSAPGSNLLQLRHLLLAHVMHFVVELSRFVIGDGHINPPTLANPTLTINAHGLTYHNHAGLHGDHGAITVADVDAAWSSRNAYLRLAIDLMTCQSVRPLNRSNISNYFKIIGETIMIPDTVVDYLNIFTPAFLSPLLSDVLRPTLRITEIRFLEFHTSYSSTGKLCLRAVNTMGVYSRKIFSAAEITAITNSSVAPYSIPLNTLIAEIARAKAYVILQKFRALPTKWFQGEKAFDNTPISLVTRWRGILDIYLTVAGDLPILPAAGVGAHTAWLTALPDA